MVGKLEFSDCCQCCEMLFLTARFSRSELIMEAAEVDLISSATVTILMQVLLTTQRLSRNPDFLTWSRIIQYNCNL